MKPESRQAVAHFLIAAGRELNAFLEGLEADGYEAAVQMIRESRRGGGRVHVTGIGKPGHVAGYMASLLSSTGTPAYFLHGTEAVHGSCGQLVAGDVVICISNSGETAELKATVIAVKNNGCKVIGVTGDPGSWLARNSDLHLFAGVGEEGGPSTGRPAAPSWRSCSPCRPCPWRSRRTADRRRPIMCAVTPAESWANCGKERTENAYGRVYPPGPDAGPLLMRPRGQGPHRRRELPPGLPLRRRGEGLSGAGAGLPTVTDVLAVLQTVVCVEKAEVMDPEDGSTPEIFGVFRQMLGGMELQGLGRYAFYDACCEPGVRLAVSTGEGRTFANLLLTIGVADGIH